MISYDIMDSFWKLNVNAGFRDENYNRNTAKRKTRSGTDPEGVDWVASHPPYKNSPHVEKDYKLD